MLPIRIILLYDKIIIIKYKKINLLFEEVIINIILIFMAE